MSDKALNQGPANAKHSSRRLAPRIEVIGQLHGQIVAFQASLEVRDISTGGFSVESDIPFPVDSVHQFKFTTSDRKVVFLSARAMHQRPITLASGRPGFSCGMAFETADPRARDGIDTLLDAAISVIEFS